MSGAAAGHAARRAGPRYVIGTGWWCESADGRQARSFAHGDRLIRSRDFFALWYRAVATFTRPDRIIVVDSASPVAPPAVSGPVPVELVSLDHNAGHAVDCTSLLCGYSRSVMLGAWYAWLCDADYFVYVEQDTLLYGQGIVERAIDAMTTCYAFGAPVALKQPLQQSFFVVRRDGVLPLLTFLARLRVSDRELSPERKFALAAYARTLPPGADEARLVHEHLARLDALTVDSGAFAPELLGFDFLPFGFGRTRPVDMDAPHFHFQHGTREEIERYASITGFPVPDGETGR